MACHPIVSGIRQEPTLRTCRPPQILDELSLSRRLVVLADDLVGRRSDKSLTV